MAVLTFRTDVKRLYSTWLSMTGLNNAGTALQKLATTQKSLLFFHDFCRKTFKLLGRAFEKRYSQCLLFLLLLDNNFAITFSCTNE